MSKKVYDISSPCRYIEQRNFQQHCRHPRQAEYTHIYWSSVELNIALDIVNEIVERTMIERECKGAMPKYPQPHDKAVEKGIVKKFFFPKKSNILKPTYVTLHSKSSSI